MASDRGMCVLNPKVEGAKQEEKTARQSSVRQFGACESRRNTVVGVAQTKKW